MFIFISYVILWVVCITFLCFPKSYNTFSDTIEQRDVTPVSTLVTPWKVYVFTEHDNGTYHHILNKFYPSPYFEYVSGNDLRTWNNRSLCLFFNKTHVDFSNIPKTHVIGISQEPRVFAALDANFVAHVQKVANIYIVGDTIGLPTPPFVAHYNFLPSVPRDSTISLLKTHLISLVVSNKRVTTGHRYRHILAEAIIDAKLPIDIWGRGSLLYPGGKGDFESVEPYAPYQYTIAIENVQEEHYFSEKITTPILHNCVPIYLGSKHVKQYMCSPCYHELSGEVSADIELLKAICENPESFQVDLSKAQQALTTGDCNLSTYLWDYISRHLHT